MQLKNTAKANNHFYFILCGYGHKKKVFKPYAFKNVIFKVHKYLLIFKILEL